MPHSLRAKLSGLRYKGILEDKDYKRLCHALDLEKAEQEPCENCDYSEIMDWEQDAKTGKAKPIYWCERHKEPCDDAISRQAVLEIAKQHTLTNDYLAIQNLPTVRPQEPKTGHWIGDAIQGEIDGQIVKGFTCSQCGAISVFRITDEKIINGDLCANCGCSMVEPRESEDKE